MYADLRQRIEGAERAEMKRGAASPDIVRMLCWGNHENTIISSANYHVLMCIVGEARNAFQLLITTRESNPMEGLEVMASVRDAINVALRPA